MRRRDLSLSPVQGRMVIACLNIGEKVKKDAYNHCIYIHKYYIPKKARGKAKE
jgi:hypothetical protein